MGRRRNRTRCCGSRTSRSTRCDTRATRAGQRIDLTAKEFALLTLLTQRSGEVLSGTRIASLVRDIHFGSDSNVVEVAMRRLRAKIDDPFPQKLIHTVRRVGCVLERRREMAAMA